jgi:hypothetical protein
MFLFLSLSRASFCRSREELGSKNRLGKPIAALGIEPCEIRRVIPDDEGLPVASASESSERGADKSVAGAGRDS